MVREAWLLPIPRSSAPTIFVRRSSQKDAVKRWRMLLEGYDRRKLLKREKQERLRRYNRERNRRKREQARRALA